MVFSKLWVRGLILRWVYTVTHSQTSAYCNLCDTEAPVENIINDVTLSPRVRSYKQRLDLKKESRRFGGETWYSSPPLWEQTYSYPHLSHTHKHTHTLMTGSHLRTGRLTTSPDDARWANTGSVKTHTPNLWTWTHSGTCIRQSSQGCIHITFQSSESVLLAEGSQSGERGRERETLMAVVV